MQGDSAAKTDYNSQSWADKMNIDFKIMMIFIGVYMAMVIATIVLFYIYNKKYPKLMAVPEV